MVEERIYFISQGLRLEGLINSAPGASAVVITHPHPLYGGEMRNAVVEVIARAYQQRGYTTLRFNFRGVGASQGSYDQGRGEQADVKAAIEYLNQNGKAIIDLTGYSFGAWVNAQLTAQLDSVQRMIMVSPPIAFAECRSMPRVAQLKLIITGSEDAFAPAAEIRALLERWNLDAHLEVIKGADHFYEGYLDQLESLLTSYF